VIRSQQDVREALDRICQYYKEHNPSSPVPLLLHRAKRLVGKDFREVVEELIPNALAEIDSLSGVDKEEQSP
jgi:type VI secretion system protein ImpA